MTEFAIPSPPPLVSVILPCYNAHRFLGQALDSVRMQTFRDYETIVIDDGSTEPETLQFLEKLQGEVRVVRQENRGLSGARNTGFREARGHYVLPLDCDDWIEPQFLERLLAALSTDDSENTFAFSHMTLEGDKTGILPKQFNLFEQLCANQLPYCLLLRRALWQRVGGYDESMRQGAEDWEFNIRLSLAGAHAVVVPEALFHYRVSASGMLLSISRQRHHLLWGTIQRKHAEAYRLGSLFQLWRTWRRMPSARPLWHYVPLLLAHRLLPQRLFQWIFSQAMRFSRSRRLQVVASDR
jgi:glycosyltransferase involved in cell wall biosynthesis